LSFNTNNRPPKSQEQRENPANIIIQNTKVSDFLQKSEKENCPHSNSDKRSEFRTLHEARRVSKQKRVDSQKRLDSPSNVSQLQNALRLQKQLQKSPSLIRYESLQELNEEATPNVG
jgi:hypothetical protein